MWRLGVLAGLAVVLGVVAFLLARSGAAASDLWRDFTAWLSLFLTVLGLGYTVYQVTLIESVTRAAAAAATQAREESRRRLIHFTAAYVHQLIDSTSAELERKEWGKAVIRLNDLADKAAQIGERRGLEVAFVRGLRDAANECLALESGRHSRKPTHEKWLRLLTDLRHRLDALTGPLHDEPPEALP